MSSRNPYTTMFDMQRRVFDQQRRFVEQSFDTHRRMLDSVPTGFEAGRSAQNQTQRLAGVAMEATIDAIEQSIPGQEPAMGDVRAMLEEQMNAGEKLTDEAWTAYQSTVEESLTAYNDVLDQTEAFYIDLYDAFLRSFEQVEQQVEEAS